MEFPITVESQDAFDNLVRTRLDREKVKQTELEQQIASLTSEKEALETTASEATARADAAERWKIEREQADAAEKLRSDIADEFKVPVAALRGNDESELRAHAEALKPLLQQPVAPVVPNAGDSPTNPATNELGEFASSLFGGD